MASTPNKGLMPSANTTRRNNVSENTLRYVFLIYDNNTPKRNNNSDDG